MFKKFALSLLFLLIFGCGQENVMNSDPENIEAPHSGSDPGYESPSYSQGKMHDSIVDDLNIITSNE